MESLNEETLRKYIETRFRKDYEQQEYTEVENEAIEKPKNNYKYKSKVAYKT